MNDSIFCFFKIYQRNLGYLFYLIHPPSPGWRLFFTGILNQKIIKNTVFATLDGLLHVILQVILAFRFCQTVLEVNDRREEITGLGERRWHAFSTW